MTYQLTTAPLAGVEASPGDRHYGVFDHGAHVWAWQPEGGRPVLWLSEASMFEAGKPVRGGVPIIFPWFGPGREPGMTPAHGFARLDAWRRTAVVDSLDEDGTLVVSYALDREAAGQTPAWPYSFAARFEVSFGRTSLDMALTVTNTDDHPFDYEEALHTYLAVGDVRQVRLEGLEGATYWSKVTNEAGVEPGAVMLDSAFDRVYTSAGTIVLTDPVWGRQLEISKQNSANTVVWNPWVPGAANMPDFGDDEWPEMICVEAANVLANAVALEPGASHTLRQRISLLAD